jgi:hypothetical protein
MRAKGRIVGILAVLVLAVGAAAGYAAAPPHRIPLPRGFQPEGIAIRHGDRFFVGSIPTGAIYRADAFTGRGSIFVPAREGRSAVGMNARFGKLYVAGGATGQGYIYDQRTGDDVAALQLTDQPTFVNDVVATPDAAWFTDSVNPVLYRVDLRRNGTPRSGPVTVPLRGIRFREGFNLNGIETNSSGTRLIVVQSNTGLLFNVNARNGRAHRIDLHGRRVESGDGLLLHGRRLFVVQNFLNRIAVVDLGPALRAGRITRFLSDPSFDIPTTVARKKGRLYVVNARFTTPPTDRTPYWVTVIPEP